MAEIGKIAIVKTTGEKVFVLDIRIANPTNTPLEFAADHKFATGLVAYVRIPRMTSEGIQHYVESFLADELETHSESVDREFGEMLEVNSKKQLLSRRIRGEEQPVEDAPKSPLAIVN